MVPFNTIALNDQLMSQYKHYNITYSRRSSSDLSMLFTHNCFQVHTIVFLSRIDRGADLERGKTFPHAVAMVGLFLFICVDDYIMTILMISSFSLLYNIGETSSPFLRLEKAHTLMNRYSKSTNYFLFFYYYNYLLLLF